MKKNRGGETLVEVMVAMSIIAVAALFLLGGISSATNVIKRGVDITTENETVTENVEKAVSEKTDSENATVKVRINGTETEKTVKKISVSNDEAPFIAYDYYYTE